MILVVSIIIFINVLFQNYNQILEGYTSISVREPLSRIMAGAQNGNVPSDPHYAFVSDDSGMIYHK